MSNFVYSKAKEALLNGDIDVLNNTLKVIVASSTYIPDELNDEFVQDISLAAIKYRTSALVDVSSDNGILDADDIQIPNYPGDAFNALVIYVDSGSDSTSRLLAYINESPGLPFSGSVSEVSFYIAWSNGPTKIISLSEQTAGGTNTVLNGTNAPGSSIGEDGDFYIQTNPYTIYGPKDSGSWPAGISLVGPTGPIVPAKILSDFVSPYSYIGVAPSGSSELSNVWKITRINVTQATPSTSVATNVAWTDRLSAVYI